MILLIGLQELVLNVHLPDLLSVELVRTLLVVGKLVFDG